MQPHFAPLRAGASRAALCAHHPIAIVTLAALAVRLVQLATPTLRWDEGWSLGLASLPWADLWQVATEESHPPLYVALLKLWIPLGTSRAMLRLPSVLAGVLAIPLTYRVARLWSHDEATALVTAALMAVWPLHVYYSQVARMYALVVLPILGAAWFALRYATRPSPADALGLALCALGALWTNYYAVWPLAAVWLFALAAAYRHGRLPWLLGSAALVVIGFGPWLLVSWANLGTRTGVLGGGPGPLTDALKYLRPTLDGMLYSYDAPIHPGLVVVPIVVAGVLVARVEGRDLSALGLAALATALSLGGMALGAHLTRWFAPRYMVIAAPFAAMLLGWAIVRIGRWQRLAAAAAAVALIAIYWPAATGSVYAKMLEVVEPIDPSADHAYLSARAAPSDRIYFNVLAKAGWYEHCRRPGDPGWSYAMRWDPVIEPMERIRARVDVESPPPSRFWFVLYQGSYGPNAPLKEWLDGAFYPAGEEWRGDTLYAAYVRPDDGWLELAAGARLANGLTIEGARWAPAGADAVALQLLWSGERTDDAPLKVFVHLTDDAGRPVAQHDTTLSTPSQRHGLLLPVDRPADLHLVVGLYDGTTGERVPFEDGGDAVTLGRLPLRRAR